MAKPIDTRRVLRSVVRPALGLSLGALCAAASVGCGNAGSSAPSITSESPASSGATTAVAEGPGTTTSAAPATTMAAAEPTATASAAPSPTATPSSTSRVAGGSTATQQPIHPPGVTAYPRPGQPAIPAPGTTQKVYPKPGPPPQKVGIIAAPGFAPAGPVIAAAPERPTRPTRRATDPDRRLLLGRSRSLV